MIHNSAIFAIMLPKFTRFLYAMRWTLLSIALITPLGFVTKVYAGPVANWVNNSLGGVLYVIFWSLVFSVFFYRTKPWKIAAIVTLVTCLLEFLQLWHPPFLEAIRSTFLGVTLIGNSFTWLDLVHYLLGCIASVWLIHNLRKSGISDRKQ